MKPIYWLFCVLPYFGLALKLTTIQFLKKYGYPSETHYITTEDGYILTVHRIPHGKNQTEISRHAVLMVHGMISSSADYVNLGSDRALGLILADIGYDVWLINNRGNSYSKNHTILNPIKNPKKFYDFSWHEMGIYDIPAAIDYILNLNGDSSLHYIGLSQGSTSFLVFASQRSEYTAKIKLASLMAPAAIMEVFPNMTLTSTVYNLLFKYVSNYRRKNIYHLEEANSMQDWIMQCGDNNDKLMVCKTFLGLVGGGSDNEQLDDFVFQIVGMNFPSEISFKQFEHYVQQFKNGGFKQFNYGMRKNMKLYSSPTPPDYNLSKISTPMAFYVGQNDLAAGPLNVKKLMKKLLPLVNYYEPPHEKFTHMDFVIARDVKKLVYNEIIRVMKMYD